VSDINEMTPAEIAAWLNQEKAKIQAELDAIRPEWEAALKKRNEAYRKLQAVKVLLGEPTP